MEEEFLSQDSRQQEATIFLQDAEVAKSPLSSRLKFLRKKGLNEEEIARALRSVGSEDDALLLESGTLSSSAPTVSSQPQQNTPSFRAPGSTAHFPPLQQEVDYEHEHHGQKGHSNTWWLFVIASVFGLGATSVVGLQRWAMRKWGLSQDGHFLDPAKRRALLEKQQQQRESKNRDQEEEEEEEEATEDATPESNTKKATVKGVVRKEDRHLSTLLLADQEFREQEKDRMRETNKRLKEAEEEQFRSLLREMKHNSSHVKKVLSKYQRSLEDTESRMKGTYVPRSPEPSDDEQDNTTTPFFHSPFHSSEWKGTTDNHPPINHTAVPNAWQQFQDKQRAKGATVDVFP